eukprot:scaffold303770_cov41-Prasinocladus_malaysianus.AAC.1
MASEQPRSAVKFTEDTKAGPRLGKAPSIQRKGTPGVALMSDTAEDMAEEMVDRRESSVSFSEDTKAGPSFGR